MEKPDSGVWFLFHLQNSVLDASKVMKNYACLRNIIQF